MKAILEFNLPEEKEEFEMYSKAGKYFSALWDISQYIRTVKKNDVGDLVIDSLEVIEDVIGDLLDE